MCAAFNVHLAASCQDSAEVSSLAFGLELVTELPVLLFFPAGGVPPPGGNEAVANEQASANMDHSAPSQPAGSDQMLQVLALIQGQKAVMSMMELSLRNFEVMIDCWLRDQGKEINQHIESVHREMAIDFQQHLDNVGHDVRQEMDSMCQQIRQMGQCQTGPWPRGLLGSHLWPPVQ